LIVLHEVLKYTSKREFPQRPMAGLGSIAVGSDARRISGRY